MALFYAYIVEPKMVVMANNTSPNGTLPAYQAADTVWTAAIAIATSVV